MENNEKLAGTAKGIKILREEKTLQKEPSAKDDTRQENIKHDATDTKKEQNQLINRWKDFLIVPDQESSPKPQKTLSDSSSCSYCTEDDVYYSSGSDEETSHEDPGTSNQHEVKEPTKTTETILTGIEYQESTSTAFDPPATTAIDYSLSGELQVRALPEEKSEHAQNTKMFESEKSPQTVTRVTEKAKVKWDMSNLKPPTNESVQSKFVQGVLDKHRTKSSVPTNQGNAKKIKDLTKIQTDKAADNTRGNQLSNVCVDKAEIADAKFILNPYSREFLNKQNQHQASEHIQNRPPTQRELSRQDDYPNMFAARNQNRVQAVSNGQENQRIQNQMNTGYIIQSQQSGRFPHPTSQSSIQQFPTPYTAERFHTQDKIHRNHLQMEQQPLQNYNPNTQVVQSPQSGMATFKGHEDPQIETQAKQSDRFQHPMIQQFPSPIGIGNFQRTDTPTAYQTSPHPTRNSVPPGTPYGNVCGMRDFHPRKPVPQMQNEQEIEQLEMKYNTPQMEPYNQNKPVYTLAHETPQHIQKRDVSRAQFRKDTRKVHFQTDNLPYYTANQQVVQHNLNISSKDTTQVNNYGNLPTGQSVYSIPEVQNIQTTPPNNQKSISEKHQQRKDNLQRYTPNKIPDRPSHQQRQDTSNKLPDRQSGKSLNKDQIRTFKRSKEIHNQQSDKTRIPTYVITKELDFVASPPVLFTPEYLMAQNTGFKAEQPVQFSSLPDNSRTQNSDTSYQAGPSKKLKLEELNVSTRNEQGLIPVVQDVNDAEKLMFNKGYKKYVLKTYYKDELNTNIVSMVSNMEDGHKLGQYRKMEDGHKLDQYSTMESDDRNLTEKLENSNIEDQINIASISSTPRTEEDDLLQQLESTFNTNSGNNNALK